MAELGVREQVLHLADAVRARPRGQERAVGVTGAGEPEAQCRRLDPLGRDHLRGHLLVPEGMDSPARLLLVVEASQPPEDRPVLVRLHEPDVDRRRVAHGLELFFQQELELVFELEAVEHQLRLERGWRPRIDVKDAVRQAVVQLVRSFEDRCDLVSRLCTHEGGEVDVVDVGCVEVAHEPGEWLVAHFAPELVIPLERLVDPDEQVRVRHPTSGAGPR